MGSIESMGPMESMRPIGHMGAMGPTGSNGLMGQEPLRRDYRRESIPLDGPIAPVRGELRFDPMRDYEGNEYVQPKPPVVVNSGRYAYGEMRGGSGRENAGYLRHEERERESKGFRDGPMHLRAVEAGRGYKDERVNDPRGGNGPREGYRHRPSGRRMAAVSDEENDDVGGRLRERGYEMGGGLREDRGQEPMSYYVDVLKNER